jgi:ABC-type amino acid transport substrate-binding protein
VVVTYTWVARPRGLKDLSGQPVATVLGYYYPELDLAMGAGFIRDDGHSATANLRKVAAGRLHHAITQQSTLDYYLKVGEKLSLHPPLVVKTYMAQCAVSPRGQVGVAAVDKAISALVKDGGLARIIAAYQARLK